MKKIYFFIRNQTADLGRNYITISSSNPQALNFSTILFLSIGLPTAAKVPQPSLFAL